MRRRARRPHASEPCSINSAAGARFQLALCGDEGRQTPLERAGCASDGTKVLREVRDGEDPVRLGEEVGDTLLGRGGDAILEEVYGEGFALPQQP